MVLSCLYSTAAVFRIVQYCPAVSTVKYQIKIHFPRSKNQSIFRLVFERYKQSQLKLGNFLNQELGALGTMGTDLQEAYRIAPS